MGETLFIEWADIAGMSRVILLQLSSVMRIQTTSIEAKQSSTTGESRIAAASLIGLLKGSHAEQRARSSQGGSGSKLIPAGKTEWDMEEEIEKLVEDFLADFDAVRFLIPLTGARWDLALS